MDMYAHVESFLEIRRHCEASSSTTMQKPLVKQWHGMFPCFFCEWEGGPDALPGECLFPSKRPQEVSFFTMWTGRSDGT